jgi:tetratricopeptide (TPR) repeat protein
MPSYRRACVACSLGLLLGGLLLAWGSPAWAASRDTGAWLRVLTPQFELLGQGPAEELEALAADLGTLHSLLQRLGEDESRWRPPLHIVALGRDQLGWLGPDGADLGPRDNRVTGYFVPGTFGDHIVFDRDPRGAPRETLFHEYLHAFVRHNLPATPLWLNEGLAEYYSSFTVASSPDGSARGLLGLPKESHLRTLQRERMIPLHRLLEVGVDSPHYHAADRRGVFYAQSWALVHFLLSDDDRRARTSRYITDLQRQQDPVGAFEAAFERSFLALESELRRYLELLPLPHASFALDSHAPQPGIALPVGEAQSEVALGDLLLAQRRVGDARERFERALAADRRHARALAGIGRVHLEKGNVPLALEWLEASATAPAGEVSWLPSLLLGEALLRSVRETLPASGERAPADAAASHRLFARELGQLERARGALRWALEREPRLAPAHAALGRAWLLEGGIAGVLDAGAGDEAVAALRQAIDLQPDRLEPAVDLAHVLCRVDRCGEARRVVEELLPLYGRVASADLLATVREQVARVELDRAARLASAMQPEQALARIEALVAALDGETLSALGPEIDQVFDVATFNAQVAAYNRALELAHAGRRAEAARVLAPVLRDARDRELLGSARQLDAVLRRPGG